MQQTESNLIFEGREAEISRIIAILGQMRCHHVILIGEAGVGKTALLQQLKLSRYSEDIKIFDVEKALLSQSTLLKAFDRQPQERDGTKLIIALDGLDALLTADSHTCHLILDWIRQILIENNSQLILVCNKASYHRFFSPDEKLTNRCQVVTLKSPNFMTTVAMVKAHVKEIYSHYHITISDDVISSVVALSHRYVHDAVLPGSAIMLLDACVSGLKQKQLTRQLQLDDVIEVVSQLTDISKERLLISDEEKLRYCADKLAQTVCGQDQALAVIRRALQSGFLKLHSTQPMAMMVFVGEKGTGKMLTAKAIANLLYGSEHYLLRVNMAEYQEADSLKRLLGDGVNDGLLKKIRAIPCAVYAFERIELAHPQVISELSDLLMRGNLGGQDLSHAIVIMTTEMALESSVFPNNIVNQTKSKKTELLQLVVDELPGMKMPNEHEEEVCLDNVQEENQAFINQFGEKFYQLMTVVTFNRLQLTGLEQFIEIELQGLRKKLETEHNIHLSYSPNLARELLTYLPADHCSVSQIKTLFDEKVLAAISQSILNNESSLRALSLLLEPNGEIQCRAN